ncbi:MAG: carbohydrate ABC transporter substrate-binding protein [Chloroflexi bacterium]|nr:carbohydrate ABC transporter substrate-binding protein [Chloroflexota bacterium]
MNSKKLSLVLTILVTLISIGIGVVAQDAPVNFISTQFNIVEEAEKARTVLADAGVDVAFVTSEEGPMLDLLKAEGEAGAGANDVVGALHGSFPTLAGAELMFDLTDLLATIEESGDVNDAYAELGRMGTEDFQYYIPWMQATYTMAAHVDALEYLPEGADLNALTWDDVVAWAIALEDAKGAPQLGLPAGGLINRFMQGAAYPSFTGGMVTTYNTPEAVAMLEFFHNELWPHVNPQSISYAFMNEPLLSGEVMLAWDHVARLKPAFDAEPDNFVAFPSPAGPAGRGFMPVIVGLGIPYTAPNPEGAEALIQYMLSPETQGAILRDLGFYPVVGGVDTSALPAGVAKQFEAVQTQATSEDAIVALLPVGLGARGGELNVFYVDLFNRVIVGGEDPQTVLDELAPGLQTLMDETGAACWSPDPASEGPCQLLTGDM